MAEDANAPQNEQIAEADAVKTEDMPQEPAEQKDVLEEDDDFEEFKDEGTFSLRTFQPHTHLLDMLTCNSVRCEI